MDEARLNRAALRLLPATRGRIARALALPDYGIHLGATALGAGYGQADLVLALLRDQGADALAAAEILLERPIMRCPPGVRDACPERSLWARAQWALGIVGEGPASDGRHVTWLARNPRLPTTDSFQRFRLLRIGMSVGQFLTRGGKRRDVREWCAAGDVELSS